MRGYFDDKENIKNSISRKGMKSWRFAQHTAKLEQDLEPTSDFLSLCSPFGALSHMLAFAGHIFPPDI